MTMFRRLIGLAVAVCCAREASDGAYSYLAVDASAPDLFGTAVDAINDVGAVAGYYVTDASHNGSALVYHAFTASTHGGPLTVLVPPGSTGAGSGGINNAGAIAGVFADAGGTNHGFLRSPGGVFSQIDPSGPGFTPIYTEAVGINDHGKIVGYYANTPPPMGNLQQVSNGFVYDGTSYSHFDVPAAMGFGTQPYVITNSGEIVGTYLDNTAAQHRHGFLYQPGFGFSTFDPPGATDAEAEGINNKGDIVGSTTIPDSASPLGYDPFGYVYSGGVFTPFAVPGAFLTEPLDINDYGQITGLFVDQNGIHGFVATPVPEPAAIAVLGVGLLGLGLVRRRVV